MIELSKDEQDYIDTERMIFDMDTKYEFNKKKSLVEYKNSYVPSKHLIKLLRKKYEFPKGKFDVIYADLPWQYNNKKTGGNHKSGATQKYNTIPTGTLRFEMSILINSIAKTNAVIFFWMTVPMEREQMTVFDALDFDRKSKVFWHKNGRIGMGYWVRHQIEFMMIGIKGDISAFRSSKRNFVHLLETPALAHSEKPAEFRKLIQELTKNIKNRKKIELFARRKVRGWKYWGDGVGL
jgi:N6-adenosine-specific RNA methylase IME4